LDLAKRREVLEDVLNLAVYGKMYEKVKKEWNQYKTERKFMERDLENLKKMYEDKKNTYEKIEDKRKIFEDSKQETCRKLEEKLNTLNTTLETYKAKLPNKDFSAIKLKLYEVKDKITQKLSQLNSEITVSEKSIKSKEIEIQEIKKNPICPLCKTPTSESEHTQKHIQKLKKEVEEINENINSYKMEKEKIQPKFSEIQSKIAEIDVVIEKVNKLKTAISNYQLQVNNATRELEIEQSKIFELGAVITKDDIEKLQISLENKNKEYNELCKSMRYADFTKEILGDNGIKKYIIKKIIPLLNKKTNEYLSRFKANYTLAFDSELNEIFKTRTYLIKAFSEKDSGKIKDEFMKNGKIYVCVLNDVGNCNNYYKIRFRKK
jgi:DNA repair exonuclease SbcCD ATPase subunit